MKVVIVAAAIIVAGTLAGCSAASNSGEGTSGPNTAGTPRNPTSAVGKGPETASNPDTRLQTPSSNSTPTSAAVAQSSAPGEGKIDLSPNWAEIKRTMAGHGDGGWGGKCLLPYSCTTRDPIDGSLVSTSFVSVPGHESVTVSYIANNPSDNTGAKLDLGHFALFFSTDAGSQFDFQAAVSDAIDAIAIGGTKTQLYPPLRITVQHPTAAKWQFKIDQS